MDLFRENSKPLEAVSYFSEKAPSWMFDKVLSMLQWSGFELLTRVKYLKKIRNFFQPHP